MNIEIKNYEQQIEQSLRSDSFYDVGKALGTIRDQQLYNEGYQNFAAYCHLRWDMAKRTAYQFINASAVVDNVRNCAPIIPSNEYQARPLTRLAPEEQRIAWVYIVKNAPNGKITSKFVLEAVAKLYPKYLKRFKKTNRQGLKQFFKKQIIDIAALNYLFNEYGSEKDLLAKIKGILKADCHPKHGVHISNFGDGICISSNQNIPGLKIDLSIYKNNNQQQNRNNQSKRKTYGFTSKSPEQNDPFKILGVDRNASADEIKNAHRRLAKSFHPDQFNDMKLNDRRKWIFEEAEERMKKVNWAFDQIKS